MPLHIILVKISPEAPTKDPLIINPLFPIKNPVAVAAMPEYEFSNEITTGISAPPIGTTKPIPNMKDNATTA